MIKLNIGSVPEHFNMPWHLAIEEGMFEKAGITLNWIDFPGGTGDMCKALRDGTIDIAIPLTEGTIKDIINGNPSKIVQTYVESPLLWGIHVGAKSQYKTIADLENTKPAISRIGSGSQLLTYVLAKNEGWDENKLEFQIIGNLDGGIKALTEGTADYFLWEHFTTKPLVDNGTFRRVGDCPSPWPCFVITVRNEILQNHKDEIKTILNIINNKLDDFSTPEKKAKYVNLFSERYNLKKEDVKEWLSITEWNHCNPITTNYIDDIQKNLKLFNVIDQTINSENIIESLK